MKIIFLQIVLRTGYETERERNYWKKEQKQNDLAEGPRSRKKRNDF